MVQKGLIIAITVVLLAFLVGIVLTLIVLSVTSLGEGLGGIFSGIERLI